MPTPPLKNKDVAIICATKNQKDNVVRLLDSIVETQTEIGQILISDGGKTPYRVKVKSSCFTHVSMLPELAPGQMIADFVATIGSIDIVLGEVDR